MLNKALLSGRVANDLEIKWTPAGIPVLSFRLAVDRPQGAEGRRAGEEKQTDFIDVVAWRSLAETISKWSAKGRRLTIEGRLQVRSYTAQDGSARKATEVVAESVDIIDWPEKDGDRASRSGASDHSDGE